jgi:hypothetical protein
MRAGALPRQATAILSLAIDFPLPPGNAGILLRRRHGIVNSRAGVPHPLSAAFVKPGRCTGMPETPATRRGVDRELALLRGLAMRRRLASHKATMRRHPAGTLPPRQTPGFKPVN